MSYLTSIFEFKDRVIENYFEHNKLLEQRIATGAQPELPFVSPQVLLGANVVYVIVTAILYKWMKGRKEGFNLKPVIAVYNAVCVVLAGYVVYGIVITKWEDPESFVCIQGDRSDKKCRYLAHVFWVFYIQKFWEFADTWFFILRRSFRQVTFLHLFHHSSITVVVGFIIPYDFCGDMYLPILLNAFVHVLMYSHYLVTAIGIKSWWRQYLTSVQLAQFVLISVQSCISLRRGQGCGAPDWAKLLMVAYMFSMLLLFGNFFVRRYLIKQPQATPPACMGVIKDMNEIDSKPIIFAGTADVGTGNLVVVNLPSHFDYKLRPLVQKFDVSFYYQLTPVGASMPNLHVRKEITPSLETMREESSLPVTYSFVVGGAEPSCKVSWSVSAMCVDRVFSKKTK